MAMNAGRSLAYAALFSTSSAFSCLDEAGHATDYWHALKGNDGADVYYHDGSTGSDLKKSDYNISESDSNEGAIMATIHQLYGIWGGSFAYAMYNDEKPDGQTSSTRAHSKGVMLFDGTKGFWLVHSFPKWPASVEEGYQGLSSTNYAQSFVCVSFGRQELESIATIQQVQWPYIYSSGVSADLASTSPIFSAWINGAKSKTKTMTTKLTSLGGHTFTHFAKSREADDDLYGDLVAPGLKADLRVESWVRGSKLPDFCRPNYPYEILNVSHVTMKDGRNWRETQDHAKYAVSDSSAKAVCIGDTNRMISQEKRGGGTLCFSNPNLWSAFDGILTAANPCDKLSAEALLV